MKRDRLYLLLALVLLFAPGCPHLAWLLPWNIMSSGGSGKGGGQTTAAAPAKKKSSDDDEAHACCGNMDDTRMLVPCNADGTDNPDGKHMCCYFCRKVCGERPPYLSTCPNRPRHCVDWTGDAVNGYTCSHCGGDCPELNLQSKPPSPLPIPPKCGNHCTRLEKCKLGPGDCCPECHQACPIWSGE